MMDSRRVLVQSKGITSGKNQDDRHYMNEDLEVKKQWRQVFSNYRAGGKRSLAEYIKLGGDVNLSDEFGSTLLIQASQKADYMTVQLLLSVGADVNAQDNMGLTAIHYANLAQNKQVIELLTAPNGSDRPLTVALDSERCR